MTGGGKAEAIQADTGEESVSFELERWLPHQFSFIANRVSARLARMYGERFNLSVTGWRIIAVLGRHEPLSAKQLANRTGMDQVNITRAATQLASQGMVSRRIDRIDRRQIVLRLSKKGRAVFDMVLPLEESIKTAILRELTVVQIEELRRTMAALVQRTEEILSDDRDWRSFVAS